MAIKAKSKKRPSINEIVRDYVKQYILDNKLNPGDPLPPETQLSDKLSVGRSSVREAIKALQALGIVEVRHGEGLYVREYNFDPVLETIGFGMQFDGNTLSEMAQIRFLLEGAAIKEAVTKISGNDIHKLEKIMEVWKQRVKRNENVSDLDEEFHRNLYMAIKNKTLIKLLEVFWITFENLNSQTTIDPQPAELNYQSHLNILEAVRKHDANLAQERLLQHFEHLRQQISKGLNTG